MVTNRISELDAAKGIGIFLVSLGHIITGQAPLGNQWAITMRELVYTFHMPFFMFLSGFLMYYSYKKISSVKDYSKYSLKKFLRLFPAFLLFSLLIFFGKYFSEKFMHVDNPVANLTSYFQVFITPQISFSGYLWYIYVLFVFYLLFPILLFVSKQKLWVWLPVSLFCSVCVYFIVITKNFTLNLVFEHFFVFTLGAVCSKYYNNFFSIIKKYALLFIFIFSVILFFRAYYPIPKLVTGIISIPAIFGLITFPFIKKITHLDLWGKYTFIIYLLNTLVIGLLKGIIFKFTTWDFSNFFIVAPILLFGGLYIPIFIKKKILIHIPYLDKITN